LTSKQEYVGAAALIGALLAAVVAGLAMRRRKRDHASAARARSGAGLSAPDGGVQAVEPAAANDAARGAANAYDAMAKSGVSAASHERPSPSDDAYDVPPLTERVSPPAGSGVTSAQYGASAGHSTTARGTAGATTDVTAAAALDAAATHDQHADPSREPQAFDQRDDHSSNRESLYELPAAPDDASAHEAPPIDETDAEAREIEPDTPTELTEPTGPAAELPPDVATPSTGAEHAAATEDIDSIPTLSEPMSTEPAAATDDSEAVAHAEPFDEAQQPSADQPARDPTAEEPAAEEPAAEEPAAAPESAAEPTAAESDETRAAAPQFPRAALAALGSLDMSSRAALAALGSLDMSLPPRAAESAEPVAPPASLTTQPVVEPEVTAQQAVPPHEPQPPRVGEQIEAGTAGHGAIAGMGAAKYGPLALDFDLELPPGPAQPLPTFTPEELARIARNKLELAAEYIELGDVAGARTLINEVIESNDAATRNEARAMLSTLAPLS
jgi:FimV-like protein